MRPMSNSGRRALVPLLALLLMGGCAHLPSQGPRYATPPDGAVPGELCKVTLPPYIIEPPDTLLIEVLLAPKRDPETGKREGTEPSLLAPQPISGIHLVKMDGTVGLGIYGNVHLAGLSLDQAREVVRQFVANSDQVLPGKPKPEDILVVVDVYSFNSKQYYVITDGAGYGEQVYPFPYTGNETVLDAISKINGLPTVASRRNIWVARRSPHGHHEQLLPVDWIGISQHGIAKTNYQVLPGDRIYVKAEKIFAIDAFLTKWLSPVERLLGITLLASQTVNSIQSGGVGGQGF